MILYPYKPASESSKALADALGIKRVSHKNSRFKGGEDKTVINWGASQLPDEIKKCNVINKSEAVAIASDKLKFFMEMSPQMVAPRIPRRGVKLVNVNGGVARVDIDHPYVVGLEVGDRCHQDASWTIAEINLGEDPVAQNFVKGNLPRIPMFTTSKRTAEHWLEEGRNVVARTILNGNSGVGIHLLDGASLEQPLIQAPLYVMYVPKKQEYRVHVFRNEVVDVQRKARRKDVADENVNWKIRNHSNGFIFARGEALGDVPEDVLVQSKLAVVACGLDFGAVDVIFSDKEQAAYVLEVNSAPGLSGSTLDGYVQRFRELM